MAQNLMIFHDYPVPDHADCKNTKRCTAQTIYNPQENPVPRRVVLYMCPFVVPEAYSSIISPQIPWDENLWGSVLVATNK